MSTTTTTQRGLLARVPRPRQSTWERMFGTVYVIVMTNLLLALASIPLLLLAATTDPAASWPALSLAAVVAVPGVTAAFAVFRAFTLTGSSDVLRTFAAAWLRHLRRSLAIGGLGVGIGVVIAADLVWLANTPLGALLTPILLVIGVGVLVTGLLALVASVERPDARLRDAVKVGCYLGLRRWYLSAVSLLIAGLGVLMFTAYPALAVGLAASPLLYAIWGNSRFTLGPVLHAGDPAQ